MSAAWSWPTSAADPTACARDAAAVLRGGGTVRLPTDCGDMLARRSDQANGELILLPSPEALGELEPAAGLLGRRLANRCWPGPVYLEFPRNTGRRYAVPRHEAPLLVAGEVDFPIAAVEVDSPEHQPATVVAVDGSNWSIVRPGVVGDAELRRQTLALVLFVCTGNTCRSPLAEAVAKRILADRLGVGPDDLRGRGLWLASAGVAAWPGEPASAETVALAAEFGVDLSGHASRPAPPELLSVADLIFAMTRSHLMMIGTICPEAADRAELLCGDAGDLPDPIGGGPDVYGLCAAAVRVAVERLADRILAQIVPQAETGS